MEEEDVKIRCETESEENKDHSLELLSKSLDGFLSLVRVQVESKMVSFEKGVFLLQWYLHLLFLNSFGVLISDHWLYFGDHIALLG